MSRFVYESIKSQIYPVIQEEILDDRHVIKVEFYGEDYPYSAAGRYYLRTADEDREVIPAELRQFFIANEYKEKYILKNIDWRSEIVGMEREEIPEIPVAAVREILANSYAHAVYNGSTYHEICIHPSKVLIYSPGSFASTYSPEDYINIGEFISKKRIEKKITIRKMAEMLNVSAPFLTDVEKDRRNPFDMEKFTQLASILNLSKEEKNTF